MVLPFSTSSLCDGFAQRSKDKVERALMAKWGSQTLSFKSVMMDRKQTNENIKLFRPRGVKSPKSSKFRTMIYRGGPYHSWAIKRVRIRRIVSP